MPIAVRIALIVYVVSFILGLVMMDKPDLDGPHPMEAAVVHAVSIAIIVLLGAWLFWKISAGRNWARIVLLVLTILSVPASIYEITQIASASPVVAGIKVFEQLMDIAVIFLLFVPGREYFKPLPRV